MSVKEKTKGFLARFSFRTGVIILACCLPCYIFSFAQMGLPISAEAKFALWVIFYGFAKAFQWFGLTILGVEGVIKVKQYFRKKFKKNNDSI